jgi:HD-like signal output (HDOD) protein
MLLGMEDVKRFVLAFSMKSYFRTALRLDLLRALWRHSLACALICEELEVACATSQGAGDPAYTAGLLHDIGRMGVFVVYPQEYGDLLTTKVPGVDLLEREQQAFGFDHCEAGGWLAGRWGLPEAVRLAASEHHNAPNSSGFDFQDLVRVAVLVTDNLGFDVTPPGQPRTLQEIRSLLPHAAQYRFDPDQKTMQARITYKLDAFD